MPRCEKCGDSIPPDTPCYQVRSGYFTPKEEFEPEEEVAYFCQECGVERGNY